MWGGQGARNLSGPPRNLSTTIPQQTQQDDLFSPVSRLSSQNSFRFGSQASIGPSQQPAQPNGGEEFPPLGRNGNGEIGQERRESIMAGLGFGLQGAVASSSAQGSRSGNGLLNAVTASARTSEARSPVGMYYRSALLKQMLIAMLSRHAAIGWHALAHRRRSAAQVFLDPTKFS